MSESLQRRVAECLDRASRSERYARETKDELMREQFLATSRKWRELARTAQEFVARGYQDFDSPPAAPSSGFAEALVPAPPSPLRDVPAKIPASPASSVRDGSEKVIPPSPNVMRDVPAKLAAPSAKVADATAGAVRALSAKFIVASSNEARGAPGKLIIAPQRDAQIRRA